MECLVQNKHQKEMNEKCSVGITHFQLVSVSRRAVSLCVTFLFLVSLFVLLPVKMLMSSFRALYWFGTKWNTRAKRIDLSNTWTNFSQVCCKVILRCSLLFWFGNMSNNFYLLLIQIRTVNLQECSDTLRKYHDVLNFLWYIEILNIRRYIWIFFF